VFTRSEYVCLLRLPGVAITWYSVIKVQQKRAR
jgi:hypothetical protein